MTTANDTIPPSPPPPPEAPRARLTRSSDDKVLSGLCGGLGRHFGVDPVVFRIAFVVISLAGGTGVLLYLVGWALVPSDRTGASAIEGTGRGRTEQVLAAVLAGVGIVVLLEEVFDGRIGGVTFGMVLFALGLYLLWNRRPPGAPPGGDGPAGSESTTTVTPPPTSSPPASVAAPPPAPEPSAARDHSALVPVTLSLLAVLAGGLTFLDAAGVADVSWLVGLSLALLLVGGALLVGARWGRGRLLIPVGVVLSMALAAVAFIDVPLRGGVGERTYLPVTVAEIDTPYRLAAGELTLDLSGIDLTGTSSRVVASVGAGRLEVVLPADAAVEVDGEVGAGELRVLDRRDEGLGVDRRVVEGGREGGGRLVLRARVGMGELEVRRAPA
ncbi:MAG TPA: PspC domain-containing protein [Acidimicrobiales bacterium]|nr:PspC domain-containing protein [Acidimicrobiales bacterium]